MKICKKHKCKLVKETFTDGNIEEEEYVCSKCIEEMEKSLQVIEKNNKLLSDTLDKVMNLKI